MSSLREVLKEVAFMATFGAVVAACRAMPYVAVTSKIDTSITWEEQVPEVADWFLVGFGVGFLILILWRGKITW